MAKFRLLENLLKISDFETFFVPIGLLALLELIGEPIENK